MAHAKHRMHVTSPLMSLVENTLLWWIGAEILREIIYLSNLWFITYVIMGSLEYTVVARVPPSIHPTEYAYAIGDFFRHIYTIEIF
jgi:hypothetical protein